MDLKTGQKKNQNLSFTTERRELSRARWTPCGSVNTRRYALLFKQRSVCSWVRLWAINFYRRAVERFIGTWCSYAAAHAVLNRGLSIGQKSLKHPQSFFIYFFFYFIIILCLFSNQSRQYLCTAVWTDLEGAVVIYVIVSSLPLVYFLYTRDSASSITGSVYILKLKRCHWARRNIIRSCPSHVMSRCK